MAAGIYNAEENKAERGEDYGGQNSNFCSRSKCQINGDSDTKSWLQGFKMQTKTRPNEEMTLWRTDQQFLL